MARRSTARAAKTPAPPPQPAPAKRGRPPGEPRTTLARWIQSQGIRVTELAAKLEAAAAELGVNPLLAPPPKTLLDAVNGRHKPSLPVVLLIRHVTAGAVDVQHWVRDLFD